MSFIRNIPLFSGLTAMEKDAIISEGSIYSYPRKAALFRQGDPLTHFYVICSGVVRLFHETPDGHDVTSHFRVAGDTVCTTDIFVSGGIHHTHAVAVSDVTALEFSVEWLRESVRQYAAFSSNLLSILSRRTHRLEVEVENHTTMSAVQLVACFLKRTCAINGFNPQGFNLPYSKSLIASRLGMTLETLSRTFPKLRDLGITVEGRQVVLHDLSYIERNVCAHCSAAEACDNCSNGDNCHLYKCGIQKTAYTGIFRKDDMGDTAKYKTTRFSSPATGFQA